MAGSYQISARIAFCRGTIVPQLMVSGVVRLDGMKPSPIKACE
jgi:hypothetical protein